MTDSYRLLDSGNLLKLEQWGPVRMVRPCSQAMWQPAAASEEWQLADAHFSRDGGNAWKMGERVAQKWVVEIEGLKFRVAPTDFGHVGVFPEHSGLWQALERVVAGRPSPQVLNLFAYSGGATLAAARAGARVCHLDASKGMVAWARENAALNGLEEAPIRWIVDDVVKFLQREVKRGVRYDGIILDPPSFGRGARGEVFKIEKDLHQILQLCRAVLSDKPLFWFFTSHTPGMTPLVMRYLLEQMIYCTQPETWNFERAKTARIDDRKRVHISNIDPFTIVDSSEFSRGSKSKFQAGCSIGENFGGHLSEGEMVIPSVHGRALPAGSYARWIC